MSATFGPVAEQHVNTSRRKLEEILVKVAMRIFMQMTATMLLVNIVKINSNINDEDDSNINFEEDNNTNPFSDDNNNQDATTKMFLITIIMMKDNNINDEDDNKINEKDDNISDGDDDNIMMD